MTKQALFDSLERCPVIAAVNDRHFESAIDSPAEVIFLLGGSLMSVQQRIAAAHEAGKYIFIHIDLAEGIGKDRAGVQFLAQAGADGVISTRANMIRIAKDQGLVTVQRFFALDSQGVDSIDDMLETSHPDLIEIMPGVIAKIIQRFASGKAPVIAGGLVQTKAEVTQALNVGAFAVSTGMKDLWYL